MSLQNYCYSSSMKLKIQFFPTKFLISEALVSPVVSLVTGAQFLNFLVEWLQLEANVVERIRKKVTGNYAKWCRFIGCNNNMQ